VQRHNIRCYIRNIYNMNKVTRLNNPYIDARMHMRPRENAAIGKRVFITVDLACGYVFVNPSPKGL
jgi:hypothetical protein